MNFFIYGSYSSGKTSEIIDILNIYPNLPIVWENFNPAVKERLHSRYIKESPVGLSRHIRVYDDFDKHEGLYKLDGIHNIIAATPNNHEFDPQSIAFQLYKFATSNRWVIHRLPSPGFVIAKKDDTPKHLQLGQVYGRWWIDA